MADTSVKQQIVDILKESTNVLVTVNANPSVDELSAALATTLLINKMNKHATAVYSGQTPPAIEFLEPEKTFENTVDSLRDFIIALDKEKADHLRYKVEGDVVKIFITPYRTIINENDLDFSQGDYNVDMVIAIGVKSEDDLDKALSSHGRILHDASVVSLSLEGETKLGAVNWNGQDMSSYSEMLEGVAHLVKSDKKLIDEQIATAFLTGIVAATDRFSNNKTTSEVMTTAARLMSAGANQQLIATKLQEGSEISSSEVSADDTVENGDMQEGKSEKINRSKEPAEDDKEDDGSVGSLAINHEREGDLDEVAAEVAADNQKSAAERAEEEIVKQTEAVSRERQTEAAEEAEKKLAEELAATAPATQNPVDDLKSGLEYEAAEQPELKGAVSHDQWKKSDDEIAEPTLGGTLNATTEQAAIDKERELADDRNRTILSHDGSSYVTEAPMFQTPLNSAAAGTPREPEVRDILSDTPATSRADMIQPPAPTSSAPTLAEIDAKNRAKHDDALSAVHEAFQTGAVDFSPSAEPSFGQPVAAAQDTSGVPALPPLPPMPDFSTLPPLPPGMQPEAPSADLPAIQDSPLGNTLPPAAPPPAAASTDPNQFRIPGQ